MSKEDKYFVKTKNNEQAFTPHVYEVHGAVRYMHCVDESKECGKMIIPGPTLAEAEEYQAKNNRPLVPKCAHCGADMKPHSMFFDEQYSEDYYRATTVNNFCSEADCLIIIGTQIQTGFANSIVKGFLIREMPIIEVNLESAINRGLNIQLIGKANETLPELFTEYYRLQKLPKAQALPKN